MFPLFLAAALLAAAPAAWPQKQEREAATAAEDLSAVGKGQHMGRQGLKPGAYITPRHRKAVQAYLDKHHAPGRACPPGQVRDGKTCKAEEGEWQIGESVPRAARLRPLPRGLLSALPKAPPGNRYVLYAGDILLIASNSRLVVDAVPLAR